MNAILLTLAAHLALMSSQFGSDIQVRDDEWNSFKVEHDKHYANVAEEALRRLVFAYNKYRVDSLNLQNLNSGFKLGINHLSDLTEQEFKVLLGYKQADDPFAGVRVLDHEDIEALMEDPSAPIPDQVDWRKTDGVVSGVKDQGQCGSCWAFATTGLLEGQERAHRAANSSSVAADGELVPLSEQQLVDCDTVDLGCQGGLMTSALDAITKEGGIESEADYGYSAKGGECKFDQSKVVMTEKAAALLKAGDEELLKKTVATYGPVAVAIDASLLFQFYFGGVLNDRLCKSNENSMNHAVLVVGYGSTGKKDYWIVKNSWGAKWGEKGYLRMSRNKKNQCGIANAATIATF